MPITLRPSHTTVTQTTTVYPTPAADSPVVDKQLREPRQRDKGTHEPKNQKSSGLPTPASVKATPKTTTTTTTTQTTLPAVDEVPVTVQTFEAPVPLEEQPPVTSIEPGLNTGVVPPPPEPVVAEKPPLSTTEQPVTEKEAPMSCEPPPDFEISFDPPEPVGCDLGGVQQTETPSGTLPDCEFGGQIFTTETGTQAVSDPVEAVGCEVGGEVSSIDVPITQQQTAVQKVAADYDSAFTQLNADLFQQAHAWADANSVEFNLPDTASLSDIVAWRASTGIPLAVSNDEFSTMLSNLSDYPSVAEIAQIWQAMGMTVTSLETIATVDPQASEEAGSPQASEPTTQGAEADVEPQMEQNTVDPLTPNLTLVQSIRQWADRHGMACDLPDTATMEEIDAWRAGPKTAPEKLAGADTFNAVKDWAARHGVPFPTNWTAETTSDAELDTWRTVAGAGGFDDALASEIATPATVDGIRDWATRHGVPCFLPAEPTNEEVAQWREGTHFRVPPPTPAPAPAPAPATP